MLKNCLKNDHFGYLCVELTNLQICNFIRIFRLPTNTLICSRCFSVPASSPNWKRCVMTNWPIALSDSRRTVEVTSLGKDWPSWRYVVCSLLVGLHRFYITAIITNYINRGGVHGVIYPSDLIMVNDIDNALQIEDVAIRCVQRNVRKFMLVRDWPWWRLLVRITPLLNVHRTEQELKTKTVRFPRRIIVDCSWYF